MSEGTEAVKEAKEFLKKAKPDLIITDVPVETLKIFKELANSEEFRCGDNLSGHYGFCLKFLMDFYLGKVPNGYDSLCEEIDILRDEVDALRSTPIKEDEHRPKMSVNGNVLRIGG